MMGVLSLQVRGPKVVVRWFSHEVADLEPVLGLLQAQDMQDHEVKPHLHPLPLHP